MDMDRAIHCPKCGQKTPLSSEDECSRAVREDSYTLSQRRARDEESYRELIGCGKTRDPAPEGGVTTLRR